MPRLGGVDVLAQQSEGFRKRQLLSSNTRDMIATQSSTCIADALRKTSRPKAQRLERERSLAKRLVDHVSHATTTLPCVLIAGGRRRRRHACVVRW